ncbi:MAG: PocR ligand-binding domain-containing protein [Chloroflexi bacterium]|nr:PocR ligand-binding domain-containing protein [Chloroflexota bacterium]
MGVELLTTKEVEHFVQLNRVTIYRLIRDAGFPALKIGGQWRFPRHEVERWLAEHGRTAAELPAPALPAAPIPSLELNPGELLGSLEIVSLLKAFSTTVELSILVVNMQGEILVDCPSCRHPFCQFVHDATPARDVCFAARSLQRDPQQIHTTQPLVDCISGLQYLQTPVWIDRHQIGYIVMGPLVMENGNPDLVRQSLEDFARQHGADSQALLEQFHLVKRFSNEQVRILTDLLSRVISTMLEIVYRRADAVQRLNKIAQLASDV